MESRKQRTATSPCSACRFSTCRTSPTRLTRMPGRPACCFRSRYLFDQGDDWWGSSTCSLTAARTPPWAQYFSLRGWSPSGDFRYRGRGEDFVNARFTALWDRGLAPDYLNQGGQDIVFSGRRDFDLDEHTRAVATGEYLSSYVYRAAFAESFALQLLPRSRLRYSLPTMPPDARRAFASTAIRILRASPRWATPSTRRRSASCTCPVSILTRWTSRFTGLQCAGA